MAAIVPAYVKILASHHPNAELWEAETTLTPRDEYPGRVISVGQTTPKMNWTALGEYEGTPADIYIGTSRGGYTDSAGRYIWASDPNTGPLYGWDPMTHVTHVEALDAYGGGSSRNARMSIAPRVDGGLVCVTSLDPASSGTTIRMYARAANAAWTSLGDVTSDFTASPILDYQAGYGSCPVVCKGEDGAIYLAIITPAIVITDTYVNVAIYRAPTDADWLSNPFVPFVQGAISEPSALADCGGLAFAMGGGQTLVILETSAGVKQYAGVTGGLLSLVESANYGTNVRAKYVAGVFMVAYLDASQRLRVRRIGSAFDAVSSAVEIKVNGTWTADATSIPAIWQDDDSTIYLAASSSSVHVYESRDGGVTWASNISAFDWDYDTATLDVTAWRGGACMVASSRPAIGGVGYTHSAHSIDLGGWTAWATTAEISANIYGYRDARIFPAATWVCTSDPATVGAVTITEAGGGSITKAFTTDLRFSVITSGGKSWKIEADATGAVVSKATYLRTICEAVSSSVAHTVSNGVYAVRVNQGSSSIVIVDDVSSTTLDTVSIPSGPVELWTIVEMETGTYRVYGRAAVDSDLDARQLLELSSGSLSSGAPATEVSSYVKTGRKIEWVGFFCYFLFSSAEVAPNIPYGRAISASGTWTTNGVSLAGEGGAAQHDDFLVCRPASLYGLDKVALTESYPSLREHFRSADLGTPGTASTTAYLAFKVAGTDQDYLAPLVASYVWSNAQRVALEARIGGSWVSVGTAKPYTTATATGAGRTVHAVVTAAANSLHIGKDDLAGGWLKVGGEVYTIAGNSAGLLLSLGEAGSQIVIRTTDEIVTPFTASAIKIVPPDRIAAFGPSAAITGDGIKAAEGFRFAFSGTIPPEGYWTVKAAVGFADVLDLDHGLNTLRTTTPNAVSNVTRSGIVRRERTGPPTRTVEVSWQDVTDPNTPQTRGVLTATPDRIEDSHGNVLAIVGTTYSVVSAYVEDHGSTGRPVMYLPAYAVPADRALSEWGWGGGIVGVISPDTWITEHAEGRQEQVDDHLRGGTLKIIEVT